MTLCLYDNTGKILHFHQEIFKLCDVFPYPGNVLDLNRLTVVLPIMLSQDNEVASWTGENKNILHDSLPFVSVCHLVVVRQLLTTHGSEQQ